METSWSTTLTGLAAVVILVALNAFFVAAEFALVGSRKTKLEEMIQAGDQRAVLAQRVKTSLNRYISATQLGITLTSLGLGWAGEPALAGLVSRAMTWLPDRVQIVATHAVAATIAFILISMLHIVLGELVPKAFALLYPEKVARWTTPPLMAFNWTMAVPIRLLNGMSNRLLQMMHIARPHEHERLHSPDEIRILVEQSQDGRHFGLTTDEQRHQRPGLEEPDAGADPVATSSDAEPVRQPLGQPPLDATRGNDHDLLGKGVAEGRREQVAERLRQQVGARCPVQVKRHGATLGGAADSGSAPSPG